MKKSLIMLIGTFLVLIALIITIKIDYKNEAKEFYNNNQKLIEEQRVKALAVYEENKDIIEENKIEVEIEQSSDNDAGQEESAFQEEIVSAITFLNVRSTPSTEGDLVGTLQEGETVTRIQTLDNGWSLVNYAQQQAYIRTDLLVKVQ